MRPKSRVTPEESRSWRYVELHKSRYLRDADLDEVALSIPKGGADFELLSCAMYRYKYVMKGLESFDKVVQTLR